MEDCANEKDMERYKAEIYNILNQVKNLRALMCIYTFVKKIANCTY